MKPGGFVLPDVARMYVAAIDAKPLDLGFW